MDGPLRAICYVYKETYGALSRAGDPDVEVSE